MLQVKAFTGGGFKLGSESQPSVAVGQPAAAGPPAMGPRKFILKMWQVRKQCFGGVSVNEYSCTQEPK